MVMKPIRLHYLGFSEPDWFCWVLRFLFPLAQIFDAAVNLSTLTVFSTNLGLYVVMKLAMRRSRQIRIK